MEELHFPSEHNEVEDVFTELEAAMWDADAKELLVQAYAAMTNDAIHAEASRLLKKMKLDVSLSGNILAAVSCPQNNPWEMFNAVMAALDH